MKSITITDRHYRMLARIQATERSLFTIDQTTQRAIEDAYRRRPRAVAISDDDQQEAAWDAVAVAMDDDIRERVHAETGGRCTQREFLTRYCELHAAEFDGEEFDAKQYGWEAE